MEKIKLLILEDLATDAELVQRTLEQSGLQFIAIVARNKNEFISAIEHNTFDAILADNSLPQFSAGEAIEINSTKNITTPFILVTGSISEEYAVDVMKKGVCDYILKDRLHRLPNAVLRAIHNYRLERERKQHMQRIIENEALLKEAAAIAHFGSWETDVINNTERWSDENFRILGYDPGEVKPSQENFLRNIHPDDREMVERTIDDAIHSLDKKKYNCRIVKNDGSIKHIAAEIVIQRDNDGKVVRMTGFNWDITEAKESEIKEKQISNDLIQRNKSLEQFTYIISHNLRSPVANMIGLSNLLEDYEVSDEEKKTFLGDIINSVKKIDDIIRDLNHILQVKQHSNDFKETVMFSELVEDIKSILGDYFKNNSVTINCDFSEINEMRTLKSYLHSIFYNLISNSIKFRHQDRPVVIEIKSYDIQDKIMLTFHDNGIGIDMNKYGEKLFGLYKRFHTDHAEGKGMGLYMVRNQVDTLGGKISVSSTINEGTEFKIEFAL